MINTTKTKTLLLLILGTFFLYFINGKYNFALAGWFYPLCMLYVTRRKKPVFSITIVALLVALCYLFSTWKMTPFGSPDSILFYLPSAGFGLVIGFIFWVDRIIYARLKSFSATMIFPLLYTIIDFIISRNPLGSWGMIGYTQSEFLSFSQLASITGMCGLTFMITWFGSVINWANDNYKVNTYSKKGPLCYFALLLLIIVFGSIRLSLPLPKGTTRIAGIHVADKYKEGNKMWNYIDKKDFGSFRELSDTITNLLINNTIKEASAGASIVEWSEVSPYILKKDQDSLFIKITELTKKLNIYLVLTPFIYESDSTRPENKVIIVDPAGKVLLRHYKYGGSFIEGTVTGNKIIPTTNSRFGKLSAIICWDADFPSVVNQVGRAGTDILFVPSADWREIDPVHGQMAIYRSIENGCSMVRESQAGWSLITDPRGKIITSMDHYQSSSWSMVGNVPNKRLFTLYPVLGDFVGWLSITGFVVLLIYYRKVIFSRSYPTVT